MLFFLFEIAQICFLNKMNVLPNSQDQGPPEQQDFLCSGPLKA